MSSGFLIFGAGGHGRVVADLIRRTGQRVVGFAEQDGSKIGDLGEPGGARVLMTEDGLLQNLLVTGKLPDGVEALALGVGDNEARLEIFNSFQQHLFPPLIHPSATVASSVILGSGTVVLAGAVVNAAARIGSASIVNSGAVVEHDCVLADAVHVSPGAVLTGGVRVGKASWIGAGAAIVGGAEIEANVIVGAGAVVLTDVAAFQTVVGIPAKPILDRT